jgi:hypothetical protein
MEWTDGREKAELASHIMMQGLRTRAVHTTDGHRCHMVTIRGVVRAHDQCARLGGVCDRQVGPS